MTEAASLPQFFVGVDSDGCVFDTMELKWKECFIPHFIRCYGLQGVSRFARESAEFVNLYSKDRGCNRFVGLIKSLDLLSWRPEVIARGYEAKCRLADALRSWVSQETKLGEPALERIVQQRGEPALVQALEWSRAVNRSIASMVHGVRPFPKVNESLERLAGCSRLVVCSGTPTAALQTEWKEHRLDRFVAEICGQESGKKAEILTPATNYRPQNRLMIGDAPGDHQAAMARDCLFFPINPGNEEASWQRFHDEGIDRFLESRFAGDYQRQLLEEFDSYLPEHPPWAMHKRSDSA